MFCYRLPEWVLKNCMKIFAENEQDLIDSFRGIDNEKSVKGLRKEMSNIRKDVKSIKKDIQVLCEYIKFMKK